MKVFSKTTFINQQFTILGTAIIIFVFRSMPGPGAGLTWFEIDIFKI